MRSDETLAFLAKQLVDHPDDVEVNIVEDDRQVTLELSVNAEDLGKVIGRRGRTAKALRTIVKTAGSLDDENVHVEIID